MSHNITASDNMAYVGETPWHGLGFALPEGASLDDMTAAAGLTWSVDKKGIRIKDGKSIPDHFALVRSDTGESLDIVGRQYVPTQPAEVMEFFRGFTEAGEMAMDTAGSLCGGRWVWGLARNHLSADLGGGDVIKNYVLLVSPNIHGKSLVVKQCSIRVVCNNTLTAALNEKGKHVRVRHTKHFDEAARQEAAEAVGVAQAKFKRFEDAAKRMIETQMEQEQAVEYFQHVLGTTNKTLLDIALESQPTNLLEAAIEQTGKVARKSPVLGKMITALESGAGANMDTAKGTLWGAFNAVTYASDHTLGANQDNRLRDAWLGYREGLKNNALETAIAITEGNLRLGR